MRKKIGILVLLTTIGVGIVLFLEQPRRKEPKPLNTKIESYWLVLHRKSNIEKLYQGPPGSVSKSKLIKTLKVNDGVEKQTPTPLHTLVGRNYWIVNDKEMPVDDPTLGPHFLTLDVPVTGEWPYGPVPYEECDGQCDWMLPGYFGLHGIGGDSTKLTDAGSSGCVRHKDEDISYLYKTLDPKKQEIRYYVEDN